MSKKIALRWLNKVPLWLLSSLLASNGMAHVIKVDSVTTSSHVQITEQISRLCNGTELCQFIPASEVKSSIRNSDKVKVDFSCLRNSSDEVIAKGEVTGSANETVLISCKGQMTQHTEYKYPVSYIEYAKGGLLGTFVVLAFIALNGR